MKCISCGGKPHSLIAMRNRSYAICKSCKPAIKVNHKKFAS